MPPAAAISLSAIGEGELVSVTANVSKLASKSKDLRLHLLLVERELHYMGENGVRFHPMVVRAMAGDRGAGIPIKGNGTTKYTFDLTAIRGDITSTLNAELEKRRASEAPGSARRDYAADGHAYTSIDLAALSVVAFVQDGGYVPATAPPCSRDGGGVGVTRRDSDDAHAERPSLKPAAAPASKRSVRPGHQRAPDREGRRHQEGRGN